MAVSDETPRTPALDVRDLSFSYGGAPALQEVDLRIAVGEFVVLLGLNGAGKTTLFSLVTRLYDTRHGHIAVEGHDLHRQATHAHACMGVVFQQPTLDLDLTVKQNLLYHGALHGMTRRMAYERAMEQLGRMGMQDSLQRRVRQLSGGQRRRVEIARGLLHHPRLLLLDEPTVGLDMASRRALVSHVHELCASQGVAVLWATHLIDEVYADDRVVVLDQGRVKADGHVADIVAAQGSETIGAAFDRLVGKETTP
ncbi:ATP-binding cassette domain-containing protein [Aidingimonas halophila]|uniref:ABC-2 type transport system ATP-binding protein n=1 Tax=Aidingimonas halophila TaxID=574349 RepID=A0A1H2Z9W0_9GAMM|nr:ATP-binding cassette domain-containing protein [Aidingimonas halophila]SDX13778.1 ABC-2 type transport system ATP-binding protein [Aidingimonas halophila]